MYSAIPSLYIWLCIILRQLDSCDAMCVGRYARYSLMVSEFRKCEVLMEIILRCVLTNINTFGCVACVPRPRIECNSLMNLLGYEALVALIQSNVAPCPCVVVSVNTHPKY